MPSLAALFAAAWFCLAFFACFFCPGFSSFFFPSAATAGLSSVGSGSSDSLYSLERLWRSLIDVDEHLACVSVHRQKAAISSSHSLSSASVEVIFVKKGAAFLDVCVLTQ